MKVTVMMPTYNRAIEVNGITLVERAIQSFLNQDYENSNLVILNDGSTDGTWGILNKYDGHPRISIRHATRNLMPPNNMNELWRHSDGELLCQLHDDDEMTKDSISIRVKEFENNPDLQVLYGGWITQDINGENHQTYHATPPDAERILQSEYINFTTLMYRNTLPFRFDPDLRYYFDWLFKIRCLTECKTGYVKEPVMIHTVHEGQETTKCRRENQNAEQERMMRKKLREIQIKYMS